MKKILLKVFNVVNSVVAVMAILSALAIDSLSWTPCIVFGCCVLYGVFAMYIRNAFQDGDA